jgi:hypothetical protein
MTERQSDPEAGSSSVTTPLGYAPAAPSRRWRRWLRRASLLLIVVTIAAGIRWGPSYLARVQALYWQRRCLRYSPPDDLVVYEQGGSAQARIAAGGGYLQVGQRLLVPQPGTQPSSSSLPIAAAHVPDCWRQYVRACAAPGLAQWLATANRRVAFGMRGPSSAPTAAVLFLHERTSPAGARRLVVVLSDFMADTSPKFITGYDVEGFAHAPATWSHPPSEDVCFWSIDVLDSVSPTSPRVRVYAGQPDPSNASHFTIRFEVDGVQRTVDGYLQDGPVAGSTAVVLTPRP